MIIMQSYGYFMIWMIVVALASQWPSNYQIEHTITTERFTFSNPTSMSFMNGVVCQNKNCLYGYLNTIISGTQYSTIVKTDAQFNITWETTILGTIYQTAFLVNSAQQDIYFAQYDNSKWDLFRINTMDGTVILSKSINSMSLCSSMDFSDNENSIYLSGRYLTQSTVLILDIENLLPSRTLSFDGTEILIIKSFAMESVSQYMLQIAMITSSNE